MKMFGGFRFGTVEGISMSHLGIALRNSAGSMVSYDAQKGEIVDVDLIDFDASNMIYAIPCAIKDIKAGDAIYHVNGNIVFVTSVENGIHVVDVAEGEKKEIIPTKSMFGFDFVTKVTSLIDFSAMSASQDKPFGNMLPLLIMSDNDNCGDLKSLLMMTMLTGGDTGTFNLDMNNPLILLALMDRKGGSEGKNFFQMMMLLQMMSGQKWSRVEYGEV